MRLQDLPKRVRVKGTWYKVSIVRDLTTHLAHEESVQRHIKAGRKIRGFCDGEEKIIYLDRDVDPDLRLETFWHEKLHAIAFEWGVELDHDIIYPLEKALAALSRGNRYLMPSASRSTGGTSRAGRRRGKRSRARGRRTP